ncbi:hypothetical protein [Micromonospora chalcea]|nr:hypothetical protein [Micromonospora chalcea]
MTATLRTLAALVLLLLTCLALWMGVAGLVRLVWAFLLFLIGATA